MKNILNIAVLLVASFCFAAGFANQQTGINYLETEKISKQDTTMNKRRLEPNRKRDMGDSSQMRPERGNDTTNLRAKPADSPPGSLPKHRL